MAAFCLFFVLLAQFFPFFPLGKRDVTFLPFLSGLPALKISLNTSSNDLPYKGFVLGCFFIKLITI